MALTRSVPLIAVKLNVCRFFICEYGGGIELLLDKVDDDDVITSPDLIEVVCFRVRLVIL